MNSLTSHVLAYLCSFVVYTVADVVRLSKVNRHFRNSLTEKNNSIWKHLSVTLCWESGISELAEEWRPARNFDFIKNYCDEDTIRLPSLLENVRPRNMRMTIGISARSMDKNLLSKLTMMKSLTLTSLISVSVLESYLKHALSLGRRDSLPMMEHTFHAEELMYFTGRSKAIFLRMRPENWPFLREIKLVVTHGFDAIPNGWLDELVVSIKFTASACKDYIHRSLPIGPFSNLKEITFPFDCPIRARHFEEIRSAQLSNLEFVGPVDVNPHPIYWADDVARDWKNYPASLTMEVVVCSYEVLGQRDTGFRIMEWEEFEEWPAVFTNIIVHWVDNRANGPSFLVGKTACKAAEGSKMERVQNAFARLATQKCTFYRHAVNVSCLNWVELGSAVDCLRNRGHFK